METIKQKLNLIHLCPRLKADHAGLSLSSFGLGVGEGRHGKPLTRQSDESDLSLACVRWLRRASSGSWEIQR